jgi:hypothetical protein
MTSCGIQGTYLSLTFSLNIQKNGMESLGGKTVEGVGLQSLNNKERKNS